VYYILGIDAGTTSFKGALFDEKGEIIASSSQEYALIEDTHGVVEFHAERYWQVFLEVVKDILHKSGIKPSQIKALAIDSQGETITPVDEKGEPLSNSIVWLDNRAVKEAEEIQGAFPIERFYDHTGQPEISATWPASKILWIKRNRPDVFAKAKKFLMLEDYLLHCLTGKYVTEKTIISSTSYFDIRTGCWWKDMLKFMEVKEEQLPEIMDSGQCIGELADSAVKQTGLDKGTLVVTGAMDQVAGMIGAGNTGGKIVTETTGTCMGVCINTDQIPQYNPKANIPCHVHAIPEKYFLILWSQTAGAVLEWFYKQFYDSNLGYALIDEEAERIMPGCEGLLMLPHLNGMACPDFNPDAKGVFYGLRPIHTKAHFARSIMESVAYMLKEHIETADNCGIRTGNIRSLGGGARSSLWNTIKADVLGREIVTLKSRETTCLGAAILAGVGVGIFDSIEKACEKLVNIEGTYKPDPEKYMVYDKVYKAYKRLYQSLKGMYKEY
jgi:xylulokinase